jgi:succinate-semialdehyde dehydrogenase/glutarate-semialdehyde dehydrogenase
MMHTGLFIDGRRRTGGSAPSFQVENPATEEVLGTAVQATADDTAEAIAAAERALRSWRGTDPWSRSGVLRTISARLRAAATDIARTITLETGKPLRQAQGEVATAADYFDWFADEARRIRGETIQSRSATTRLQVEREPIGVVAVLTSWNFPVNLPARKIAAALAAGCTVIARPSEEAPASSAALFRCMEDVGLPNGAVNLLLGDHQPIVPVLMQAACVRKISFTGSTAVGKALMGQAATTVKRLSMELGGHASAIVFEDADVDLAARDLIDFKFRNAGQICISPSRFYVHAAVCDRFVEQARAAVAKLRLGNGLEPSTDVGPLINRRRWDAVDRAVAASVSAGATLTTGGHRPPDLNQGHFFEPTILRDVPETACVMQDEPFGPIVPINTFESFDDVMDRANALEYGLSNYVYTQSLSRAHAAIAGLQSGMIAVNNAAVATVEGPFGGVKQSGFGSEGGSTGIDEYLVPKFAKITLAAAI